MNRPPATPRAVLEAVPPAIGRLIVLNLLSGIVLVIPFFRPQMETPGFGLLAITLLLPYLVVCWRLLRAPEAKEGPGLCAGIGGVFAVLAALGCAVAVQQADYLPLAYFGGLGLTHALMIGMGLASFRQGSSRKPTWRVLLRSILDPVVYYGVVFFLALGALGHQIRK